MQSFAEKITITGGKYGGRKISTPGGKTHPMGSRERLALFNMLGATCEGATVLDAFAGSGALGVEALSRGASFVVFVDNSSDAVRVISRNLAELGINDSFKIVKESFPQVFPQGGLADLEGFGGFDGFDVVLADPPYDKFESLDFGLWSEFLENFLREDGVFVLSHPGEAPVFEELELLKTRKYAAAHLSVYTKK